MMRTADLIDALGGALLREIVSGAGEQISDVALGEPDEVPFGQPDNLILGVGTGDPDAAVVLLRWAADASAGAVVLKAPLAANPRVREAAEELRIGVIELQPQASWTHLVWLVRSVLDRAIGVTVAGDASVYSDLFSFADAAAAIVGAPVTIEDAHSRVLAYSAVQDVSDPARISTIIGRRIPEEVVTYFQARGVFRRLRRSSEPIWVDEGPGGVLPRLIIPVRAGGELLGSIWAVTPKPVPPDQVHELEQAASVLALHLLRLRAQTGAARRMSAERLRAALIASTDDADTESWLRAGPWRVVALSASAAGDDLHRQIDLWESIVRRYGWSQPLLTEVDGVPLTVVTAEGAERTVGSWPWLRAIVEEVYAHDSTVFAVAGGCAQVSGALPQSRAEAIELSRLARAGQLLGPTVELEAVWYDLIVERARAAVRMEAGFLGGPIPDLLAHDRSRGTGYVATLATYLQHYGEPAQAARSLHIHPNTLRYRMSQMRAIADVDLTRPRVRLALQLQLIAVQGVQPDAPRLPPARRASRTPSPAGPSS
ncbi:helix-turn-helix domain-containing protein (plasmid) [Rhodococcus opacus]|uniref:Putative PucR family transcriptional regulator n=1 Tax=Rhodococcus opacus M213 TaxID=1129896 RepID=K8XBK9_RHOOP|nr:PucR family transcriptional regulator [Rhodococcus opacus]EKT78918.1 putative PucR family transcriptional regulator [Rhodococcus opacus M213]MDV6245117.1 helix-turn-helix domain-containing protein [Rhodococcus opacus]MDV7088849.1 helix-turn-helix domain-containing protein [Rhodococcus opacus]WKN60081.1 helix-turn-helix domain-containing protein [Rhodococcus opacus]